MIFLYINTLETPEDRFITTRIYQDYHKLMGFVAERMLHDHQLAEDAVQQTFVNLIKNISTLKKVAQDKIQPYIFIALRNTIFDIMEKNKKYDTLDETFHIDKSIENEIIDKIQLQDIIQEINKLPENDITILQLTYLLELKDSQIAKQLDISVSAVKKRRERAKIRLYNKLTEGRKIEHDNE